MARAVALGLSASAIGALLRGGAPAAAAQDQEDPLASWPPPSYIEEPDTEILMPIEGPLSEETVTFRLLNQDFGYVTDFVDLPRWPEFNVGDSCITVGVGLVLLAAFRR